MANRDELKKALDYLRRKDPQNDALQKFDRQLRSYTTINKNNSNASIKLYDEWNKEYNQSSSAENMRKFAVRDINGGWESKKYQETMDERGPGDADLTHVQKMQKQLKKQFGIKGYDEFLTYQEAQRMAQKNRESLKKNDAKAQEAEKNKPEKKKDGERDGVLGFLDRYVAPISKGATEVLAPGNQERMKQIQEDKYGKVTNPITKAADEDRGTETKVLNTAGALAAYVAPYGQAYKAADVAFNKIPKLANIANPYVQRAIKGAAAGGMAEAGLSAENELVNPDAYDLRDYAIRTGLGVAGGAVLDPALYGAGRALNKGFETAAEKAMKELVPSNEQTAKGFADGLKMNQSADVPIGDFPNISNRPNTAAMQELIPNATETLSPLRPRPDLSPEVPKIGQRVDELPPIREEDFTLADRAEYFNGQDRPLPDYSNAKPVVETYDGYNQYGVQEPIDLVEQAPPDYWQGRYDAFVEHVQTNYDTNRLTQEALEDLWSQFARYDEPVTLEQVVDLAYANYQEPKTLNAADVWDQMGNRPPVSQNAKNIMGIDESAYIGGEPPTPRQTPQPEMPQQTITRTVYKPPQQAEQVANMNIPEQPIRAQEQPVNIPQQPNERGFINTLRNSEKTSDGFLDELNRSTYKPVSNEQVVEMANRRVAHDIETAVAYVKNAKKFTPEHVATAHRLIDEFQKSGDFARAVEIAETAAEQGTKAGQSVQAFSIYNRLTPEGQLVRAQRRVSQINENIGKAGKPVVLTEDIAKNITETADSLQKLTGQEELAKDVIKVMDKFKSKKESLTDDELQLVRSFVDDARKFIGDLTPKAKPTEPKPMNPRSRDKVVDFMSKQEELARKRLKETFTSRANSLPVDVFYDLSVIGASKMAKGTVKFADFSEQMVKEFGEQVRPYMQQLYDKAADTFNLQSESLTRKRLSEVEKIANKALKDKVLEANEADAIRQFAKQVAGMTGDAKIEASMELQATLQALERPTLGRRISVAQTIGQLLNPKTIVRNAIGNEMFYRVERISKYVATPIDIARSKLTGSQRTVTFRTFNQGNYWRNWLTGAKAGWKGVNPQGLQTQYDLGSAAFKSKFNPLTYFEKTLGASLKSFDYAGYKRAYNKTLGELATLKAMNEGLKGKELKQAAQRYMLEADEIMMNMADAYGKYSTFQDNTKVSVGLEKLKKGMNFGKDFGFGDLVLKYPKTPGNLLIRALEYSPLGALRSISILVEPLRKNVAFNSPEFAMSLSRAIIGTGGFSALGFTLANLGILTGSGHSDYEVKSLEQNSGKQPNSVNVTALKRWVFSGFDDQEGFAQEGDTFVSYDWAQPLAIATALGTGVSQSMREEGELSPGKAAVTGIKGAANTLVNSSVLSGVKKAFEFYPGQTFSDKLVDIAGDLPSSFVPTFSNQIRQADDNTARSTYDPDLYKTYGNRAINRVPGMEKSLPPAYDTLGNKREVYQDKGNTLFNVFLNPSFVKKYKPTPEAKFVLDFINQSGEKTVAPRNAPKTITIEGEKVKLSANEYSELQRIMGEETQKGLERVVPRLQGETDFEKIRKELEKVLRNAGEKGRDEIRRGR